MNSGGHIQLVHKSEEGPELELTVQCSVCSTILLLQCKPEGYVEASYYSWVTLAKSFLSGPQFPILVNEGLVLIIYDHLLCLLK